MTTVSEGNERRVLPRWRHSKAVVGGAETAPLPLTLVGDLQGGEVLDEKLGDWGANQYPLFASDAVGAGILLSQRERVFAAAKTILRNEAAATPAMLMLARAVLTGSTRNGGGERGRPDTPEDVLNSARQSIRRIRSRLLRDPRDPIAHADMALSYANLGLSEKARDAIERAVALAPDSRFVLRAATRLFVHQGDAEHALYLLSRSSRTKLDPWLVASEIAASEVAGRNSKLAKVGRSLVSGGRFAPSQTSELESALASLELSSGKAGVAKKLFESSLSDPTDNAVAQAEWATKKLHSLSVSRELLSLDRTFEARALAAYTNESFEEALKEGMSWLFDEPFSTQPARFGSMLAATGLENYETSIQIARAGLAANPQDLGLLNNLVFAQAMNGETEAASDTLATIAIEENAADDVALNATKGLVLYRQSRIAEGQRFYEIARSLAKRLKLSELQAQVVANWAREEALVQGRYAEALLKDSEEAIKRFPDSVSLKLAVSSARKVFAEIRAKRT